MELEPELMATETIVPVYFALEDDELLSIYTQTQVSSASQGSSSAAEGMSSHSVSITIKIWILNGQEVLINILQLSLDYSPSAHQGFLINIFHSLFYLYARWRLR